MSSAGFQRYQFRYGHEPGVAVYEGYVYFTGATAGTVAIKGCSTTLTYNSATGTFYLTLNRPGQAVRSWSAQHYASTGALLEVVPNGTAAAIATTAQTGTVAFVMKAGSTGVATNPTATDQIWVHFTLGTTLAGAR